MFEMLESIEGMFDEWYSKGYILIALVVAFLVLIYFIFKGLF